MKFEFIISKWANFYFFVQNLSEWHFSNRKEYNILWRKELGVFTLEEESALKSFKEIRLNYPSGKTFFEQAFFKEDDPWLKLGNSLVAEKYKTLKDIFDLFKNKFEVLYKNDLPFLEQWQKELEKKTSQQSSTESISKTLSVLYNVPIPEITINVYLLFSSPTRRGGGANIDGSSVSVETSRQSMSIASVSQLIGLIWHETVHLCFEKKYFFTLVEKKLSNNHDAVYLVKELTVCTLFPKGVLAINFLQINKNKEESLHAKIPIQYNKQLLALAEIYVQENKPFDDLYIEKIHSMASELKLILK